mmetsp:Transcript_9015/g.19449  ORF Transcript_9015/g.19449 Transcript_9015/m.19449 type:complete len:280 (-) Transcript_9015:411-1250(-)
MDNTVEAATSGRSVWSFGQWCWASIHGATSTAPCKSCVHWTEVVAHLSTTLLLLSPTSSPSAGRLTPSSVPQQTRSPPCCSKPCPHSSLLHRNPPLLSRGTSHGCRTWPAPTPSGLSTPPCPPSVSPRLLQPLNSSNLHKTSSLVRVAKHPLNCRSLTWCLSRQSTTPTSTLAFSLVSTPPICAEALAQRSTSPSAPATRALSPSSASRTSSSPRTSLTAPTFSMPSTAAPPTWPWQSLARALPTCAAPTAATLAPASTRHCRRSTRQGTPQDTSQDKT